MSIPSDNYVGEPNYPAPWTTSRPLEGLRDLDAARIVSLSPDVCLTPVGSSVVPIPYPVVDYCGHDQSYTPSVRFTRKKAMVMRSCTTHVHGDAPGVKKGVKSGTVEGICEPIGHAAEVRAEGSNVIRHLDRFWMNNKNTQGEAIFVRDTKTFAAPADDDPIPGSLRWTSSGAIMSDASPEPLVMGAQYASAGALATVPQPVPGPISPDPVPMPRPPGQIIRPNIPQWNRPPPTPEIKIGPWLGRLGKFGRFATGVGAFVAGMWPSSTAMPWYDELPQDEFEGELFRKARELQEQGVDVDDISKWFEAERQLHRRRRQTEESPQPQPIPRPDTVTVTDEDGSQKRCLVGPYEEIEPICRGEAHHIVPDMAYRLGRRPVTALEKSSTADRIPNAPTFNQGMSICLLTRQHGSASDGLHGILRQRFSDLASPVPGTAPMGVILAESLGVIQQIPDLPPECKALATALATSQVGSNTGFAAPGRTRERPLPSGQAEVVLKRGHY